MSRHLPPLNALRAFEAAARHSSFARAAEELNVTPAAISQQIKQLEAYLGVTLFSRGPRLSPSDQAVAVLPLLSEGLDLLERAAQRLRVGNDDGPLVVSVPPTFAARWLVSRLDGFQARHPDIGCACWRHAGWSTSRWRMSMSPCASGSATIRACIPNA